MSTREFNIKRSKAFRWLLVLFSATEARSKVRIEAEHLDVHFGPFHERIAFNDILTVEQVPLEWWQYSIGWRVNLKGGVGLIGDAANVVRLTLAVPFRARLVPGTRVWCRALSISLEEPERFVAAVAPLVGRRSPA